MTRSFPGGPSAARTPSARTLFRRRTTLATLLFRMTPGDLRRQLLASHPEIPQGYSLADFQRLWRYLEFLTRELNRASGVLPGQVKNPRNTWLSLLGAKAFGVIEVGTQQLSVWDARLEIVRRAIDYLENR